MLEVMQFYVSGFWTWLGLTIGLGLIVQGVVTVVVAVLLPKRSER